MEHEITVLHAEQIAAPPAAASRSHFPTKNDFREQLRQSLGRYCICEFFPGDGQCRVLKGILREIGQNYLLLYQEDTNTTVACEFTSLRFVTLPSYRP